MSPAARLVVAAVLALGASSARHGPAGAQEPERVVRQLDFRGNEALSDEILAAAISTTNSSWFARSPVVRWIGLGEKRYFDEQEFRRDVVRLEVLYKRSGYPDVRVDTLVRRTPEAAYVTFTIHEGQPIRVTAFGVTGLDSLPARVREETLADLPLEQGAPFNRFVMQATADTIVRRLMDRGYPSARVYSSFETERAAHTASVTLESAPGARAEIGAIEVTGVRRVDTSLVRALMISRPGRLYSQDELFQSQRNLYRSDLFRFATVNVDTAAFDEGDRSVPLQVQVNEARRRRIRGGLGYATNDCFRGSLGWTSRNFLGGGRILDLASRISKVGVGAPFDWGLADGICGGSRDDTVGSARVNYHLSAAVHRPAFLSPSNTIAVSIFTERRSEFKVYVRRETGASVTLTRETPRRRLPLSLSYTLTYGRTEATAVNFCAFFNACTPDVLTQLRQNRVFAALTGTASLPRVNNPVNPTRGSLTSFEVTHSSRYIGSSPLQQFTRVVADAAWYRPLSSEVVLSWRLRGGLIFAPRVGVATESGAFIPPEQRFYAGGPNDVRGYERNELGPVIYVAPATEVDRAAAQRRPINPDSVQVAATGGNSLTVANVEIRVPSPVFASRLRLAAFVDAGATWQRGTSPARFRVTPGVGLRVATPLGPARLDLAYNPYRLEAGPLFEADAAGTLNPVPGRDQFVLDRSRNITIHFAVGQAF